MISILPLNTKRYFRVCLHHRQHWLQWRGEEGEVDEYVHHFTYPGSFINPDRFVSDESSAWIHKAPFTFSTYITCGVGEISVSQQNTEYTVWKVDLTINLLM